MPNKDKIQILNKIMESLDELDQLVTINGYGHLWSAKQLVTSLITILTIEENVNEDTIGE